MRTAAYHFSHTMWTWELGRPIDHVGGYANIGILGFIVLGFSDFDLWVVPIITLCVRGLYWEELKYAA